MDFVYYYPNNNNNNDTEYDYESSDNAGFLVIYGNLALLADVDTPIIIKPEDEAP